MKRKKMLLYFLVIVALLAFMAKFQVVAEFIAGIFGTTPEQVQEVASIAMPIAVGTVLIYLGLAVAGTVAVVLGGALILLGAGMVAMGAYRWFKPANKDPKDL